MGKCEVREQKSIVYCDTYNCRRRADWWLGNPDGPIQLNMQLCSECKESLEKSLLSLKEPEKEEFVCEYCGKSFKSVNARLGHYASCEVRKAAKEDEL